MSTTTTNKPPSPLAQWILRARELEVELAEARAETAKAKAETARERLFRFRLAAEMADRTQAKEAA